MKEPSSLESLETGQGSKEKKKPQKLNYAKEMEDNS